MIKKLFLVGLLILSPCQGFAQGDDDSAPQHKTHTYSITKEKTKAVDDITRKIIVFDPSSDVQPIYARVWKYSPECKCQKHVIEKITEVRLDK